MKHFSGRVAFVTGGASGIGYGLVQTFLGLGMKVVVVEGIRSNAPYILTHVEFRGEVRELCTMLDSAFPREQDVPADRQAFEDRRRAMVEQLRALAVKD